MSWIANLKGKLTRRLIMPILAIGMVGSFVTYDFVKAMPAKAAPAMASPTTTPLDNNSVGALLSLDQAMETLAARVTPAIVNVTVTSHEKANMAGGDADEGEWRAAQLARFSGARREQLRGHRSERELSRRGQLAVHQSGVHRAGGDQLSPAAVLAVV